MLLGCVHIEMRLCSIDTHCSTDPKYIYAVNVYAKNVDQVNINVTVNFIPIYIKWMSFIDFAFISI